MGFPCSVPRLQAPHHWLTGPRGQVPRDPGSQLAPCICLCSVGLCVPLYLPGLLQILDIHLSWDLPEV